MIPDTYSLQSTFMLVHELSSTNSSRMGRTILAGFCNAGYVGTTGQTFACRTDKSCALRLRASATCSFPCVCMNIVHNGSARFSYYAHSVRTEIAKLIEDEICQLSALQQNWHIWQYVRYSTFPSRVKERTSTCFRNPFLHLRTTLQCGHFVACGTIELGFLTLSPLRAVCNRACCEEEPATADAVGTGRIISERDRVRVEERAGKARPAGKGAGTSVPLGSVWLDGLVVVCAWSLDPIPLVVEEPDWRELPPLWFPSGIFEKSTLF